MFLAKSATVIFKVAFFMFLTAAPATVFFGDAVRGSGMGILFALLNVFPFVLAGLVMAAPFILALRYSNRSTLPNLLLLGAVVGVALAGYFTWIISSAFPGARIPMLILFGGMGACFGTWGGGVWFFLFSQRNKSQVEAQAGA